MAVYIFTTSLFCVKGYLNPSPMAPLMQHWF